MAIKINFDAAKCPEEPTIVLAKRNGDKLGLLEAKDIQLSTSLNDAAELSFNIYRELNGITCPIWDDITNFKLAWVQTWDMWFEITVELDESTENVYKTVTCIQLGHAELSQINLYNIQINTEDDILRDEYEIPTTLYNPDHPEASLLHRILEKAPHYRVKHVDSTIAKIQRIFEFNDTSIYDAFQNIAKEINCLFILDSGSDEDGNIDRTISVYDLESNCMKCGYRGEFVDICPECGSTEINEGYGNDTGIFVTADELADSIQLSVDTDNIKNCFKLEGGDDMMTATIRNCNPNGTDYIWYISDSMKMDMSEELVGKLEEYDKQYAEYYNDKEYRSELNDMIPIPKPNELDALEKYNDIVERYRPYLGKVKNDKGEETGKDKADEYLIPDEIIGYRSVMKIYYNVIDLVLFLRSAMMPTAKLADTDAKKEAAKLTTENISPVAAQSIANMSEFTADNVVLSMAKVVVDSRYQTKVNDGSTFNNESKVWTGSFTVTNYSDKEDTATSKLINVTVNDEYETFIKQKIEKALAKGDDKDFSIAGLFKLELEPFKTELKKYALNRLVSFHDACQSAIDILVEQGVADKNTWGNNTDGKNLYDHLYIPYKQKIDAIQDEMNDRSADVDAIAGVYDENDAVVKKGLQNYIEDLVEDVQGELNFEEYLGKDLWLEFVSFRRDDKYSNDNYVSDGLSNSELINKANEFIETANKEIYKSNELQTSISASLYNLLVIDRFTPIVNEFEVGNWIRVMVDGVVYKLRLVNYEVDYDDMESLSVEFADEVRVASNVRSVQDVINQASSMATSYDSVKRQAKRGEQSDEVMNSWFENGLDTTYTKIVSGADGQSQVIDNHGILLRKQTVDGDYEPTQMKFINSTIAITDDNWNTTKTAIGEYYYFDPITNQMTKAYGVNAETIIGKLLLGEKLLLNNENNTVSFDERGLLIKGDESNVVVSISPENANVIDIKNGEESVFNVNKDGNLYITGAIIRRSINIDNDIDIDSNVISGLAPVARSGDYVDLIWGSGSQGQVLYLAPGNKVRAKTIGYNELAGKPTKLSQFTNDEGFIDNSVNNLINYYNNTTVDNKMSLKADKSSLSDVATSGSYDDLTDKPNLFSGKYNDLTGKPTKLSYFTNDSGFITKSVNDLTNYYDKTTVDDKLSVKVNESDLSDVATSGNYNDLTNKPSLSAVATSGQYTDLKASISDAGKLMYVDDGGNVTSITIENLKELLGIGA